MSDGFGIVPRVTRSMVRVFALCTTGLWIKLYLDVILKIWLSHELWVTVSPVRLAQDWVFLRVDV
jgi:hypothetical protein